jgi:hypothetical protein
VLLRVLLVLWASTFFYRCGVLVSSPLTSSTVTGSFQSVVLHPQVQSFLGSSSSETTWRGFPDGQSMRYWQKSGFSQEWGFTTSRGNVRTTRLEPSVGAMPRCLTFLSCNTPSTCFLYFYTCLRARRSDSLARGCPRHHFPCLVDLHMGDKSRGADYLNRPE